MSRGNAEASVTYLTKPIPCWQYFGSVNFKFFENPPLWLLWHWTFPSFMLGLSFQFSFPISWGVGIPQRADYNILLTNVFPSCLVYLHSSGPNQCEWFPKILTTSLDISPKLLAGSLPELSNRSANPTCPKLTPSFVLSSLENETTWKFSSLQVERNPVFHSCFQTVIITSTFLNNLL